MNQAPPSGCRGYRGSSGLLLALFARLFLFHFTSNTPILQLQCSGKEEEKKAVWPCWVLSDVLCVLTTAHPPSIHTLT